MHSTTSQTRTLTLAGQPARFCVGLVFAIALLCASPFAHANNQFWTNAPTDVNFTNTLNWQSRTNPAAVPGLSTSTNVAIFNVPLQAGLGGAGNPITNADTAGLRGMFFDAGAGPFVIGRDDGSSTNGSDASTERLFLGHSGFISNTPACTSPIVINSPIFTQLPSSTAGLYAFVNNAASPSATLTIMSATHGGANTRGTQFTLDGSNTGNNVIASVRQASNFSTGVTGITKQGLGTWILTGTNGFRGGNAVNFVNQGMLVAQNGGAFGLSSPLVTSNATLRIDGVTLNVNIVQLQLNGTILFQDSSGTNAGLNTLFGVTVGTAPNTSVTLGTVNSSDIWTLGNVGLATYILSGGAVDTVLHVTGPGKLILAQANTYKGKWSLDAGTLAISNSAALGTGLNLQIAAGATFDTTILGPTTYPLAESAFSASGTGSTVGTTAATIKADGGGTVSLGSVPITLAFAPTTFSGSDVTHPSVYVSQGTLSLGGNPITVNNVSGTPLDTGTYLIIQQVGGSIVHSAGSPVTVTGSGLLPGRIAEIQFSGGSMNMVVSPYTAQNLEWLGTPSGVWDRLTTPDWTNTATLSTSQFNISDRVTFDAKGSAFPTVNVSGTMIPGSVTVDTTANNYTFSGVGQIAGGTSLTNKGTGTLTLSTVNTYSGGTVAQNGTLQLGANNALPNVGSGDVQVLSPAILDLNGFNDTINALIGNGTVDSVSGGAPILTIGNNGNSGTFSGVIKNTTGSVALAKNGTGTNALTGANTYTGPTTVNLGVLVASNYNALGSGLSDVTINGGTLRIATNVIIHTLNGAAGSFVANSSPAGVTNTLTLLNTVASAYTGAIVDGGGGALALVILSNAMTLNGNCTYSGGTLIASNAQLSVGVINGTATGTPGSGGIIASNGAAVGLTSAVSTSTQIGNNITTVSGGTVNFFGAGSGANGYNGAFIGDATTTNIFHGALSFGGTNEQFTNFLGTVGFMNSTGGIGNRVITGAVVDGGDNTTFTFLGGTLFNRNATTFSLGAMTGGGIGVGAGGITGPSTTAAASTYIIGLKGVDCTFSGYISGTNTIVKSGPGRLTFDGATNISVGVDGNLDPVTNYTLAPQITYFGNTVVSNGTLALIAPNTLTNGLGITLASPTAVLDVSQVGGIDGSGNLYTNGILEILPSQPASAGNPAPLTAFHTLGGIGTIRGSVLADAGSTLLPGYTALTVVTNPAWPGGTMNLTNNFGTGVLTVTNNITINGAVNMRINLTNAVTADEIVAHSFTIGAGATLTVTNIGLERGGVFQMFSQPVSGFASVVLSPLSGTNVWENRLAIDGTLILHAPSFSTNPTNILFSVTGGGTVLNLSWPADHLNWTLEVETNTLAVGISTNWFRIATTASMTSTNFPIVPANGTVFYRLIFP